MLISRHRNFVLALAAAAFITVAGCSSQDQTAVVSQKALAAKPKPAAAPKKAPEQNAPAQKAAQQQAPQQQTSNKKAPAGPTVTLPKGTAMIATVSQTVTASKSKVGDSFAATLATSIKVDGKTVVPKGAKLTGHIVSIKKHEMKVALESVVVRGKSVPLETNSVSGVKTQTAATQTNVKSSDQSGANKDVNQLAAKSQLTFKLAKSAAVPIKATKAAPAKG